MNPLRSDLELLRGYNFVESNNWKDSRINRKNNTHLLGVKAGKLVRVSTQDVTCLNLFLRLFGKGKLAHTQISIKSLNKYLVKYTWDGLPEDDKAKSNVLKIASKTLVSTICGTFPSKLFVSLAKLTHTNSGRFYLTSVTSARDVFRQTQEYTHLFKIDNEGVETTIKPTELINSKNSVNTIFMRNAFLRRISTPTIPRSMSKWDRL